MTVGELAGTLAKMRPDLDVMIQGDELLVEVKRGAVMQSAENGDDLGTGTGSQWLRISLNE